MDQDTSRFVERMGFFFEEDGQPRIAGRLFGMLYLSDAPISLDDLAAGLGVSKASVSINARLLAQRGMLERVTRPGDRRDYYQVGADIFARTMSQRVARIRTFRDILKEFETSPAVADSAVATRFAEYDEGYAAMLEAIDAALTTWRARRPRPAAARVEAGR